MSGLNGLTNFAKTLANVGLLATVISLVNTIFLAARWRALSDGLTVISLSLVRTAFYGTAPRLVSSQAVPNSYPNISMSCRNLSPAICRVSSL